MKIRQAKAHDAVRCAEFCCVHTAEELKGMLRKDDTQWLVIEDDNGNVVGLGIINFWNWNKMAWIWNLWVNSTVRGKGYGRALLKGMLKEAKKGGARVIMNFGPPNPHDCSLCELLVYNGFRVCGMNDRWFADQKDATAVFYGYDL